METLRRLHAFPPLMAEAMAMRDMGKFGELIDLAWQLNVDLDPDHATPVIESLRESIRPHVLGSKLLGAGGGGFLLIVCGSPEDAVAVRAMLEKRPPNGNARFFDYSISRTGPRRHGLLIGARFPGGPGDAGQIIVQEELSQGQLVDPIAALLETDVAVVPMT